MMGQLISTVTKLERPELKGKDTIQKYYIVKSEVEDWQEKPQGTGWQWRRTCKGTMGLRNWEENSAG